MFRKKTNVSGKNGTGPKLTVQIDANAFRSRFAQNFEAYAIPNLKYIQLYPHYFFNIFSQT
jgi:hypothetical protein